MSKKFIALLSIVVVLSIVVAAFSSCKGKKKEEDATTTTTSVSDLENSDPKVTVSETQAVVAYGDCRFQILTYPDGYEKEFDFEFAQANSQMIDMNFDGVLDVCIAKNKKGNDVSYYCWVYSSASNDYVYNEELSALKNISVDGELKRIFTTVYEKNSEKVLSYKWVEGKLTLDKTYGDNGEEIPSNVSQTVKENTVGKNKKPSKNNTTSSTTEKKKKPTTTKKPAGQGVSVMSGGNFDSGWY